MSERAPAGREAQLAQLGAALQAASAAGDWARLDGCARALGGQLQRLAARGPWSAAERAALEKLRAAHDAAARHVDGAALALEKRLGQLRANEEGWLAYALHSPTYNDTDDGASRAK